MVRREDSESGWKFSDRTGAASPSFSSVGNDSRKPEPFWPEIRLAAFDRGVEALGGGAAGLGERDGWGGESVAGGAQFGESGWQQRVVVGEAEHAGHFDAGEAPAPAYVGGGRF